jgi:electron transport complex protein RnfD
MDNNNIQNLTVSATPHIRSSVTTQSIMRDVLIALLPAAIMGVVFFGLNAALIIVISVASSVIFEAIYEKLAKKPSTIGDLSAAVTGLLLAMNLPATCSFWVPIVGSFVAVIIAKQLFGGIGFNFINPALAGRAFLMASYPSQMMTYPETSFGVKGIATNIDAISNATPLQQIHQFQQIKQTTEVLSPNANDYLNALVGNIGGVIGETCAIALILGGLYLLIRKVISWHIPVCYIATVFVLTLIFGGSSRIAPYELLCGGLMLGAFFMATDYTTSPMTNKGKVIFAIGCGFITTIIRLYGGYPEGVSYSILLMNLTVPLIDRFCKQKKFGYVKPEKKKEEAK